MFRFSSQMAELLFHMEKLRGLMKKYNHVVQRYHVQYLAQFDALVLNDTIQVPVNDMIMCVCTTVYNIRCNIKSCAFFFH